MRIIRFVKNQEAKQIEVDFASVQFSGECRIQFSDVRRIPTIADEFDGIEAIEYTDEEAGRSETWDGYSYLKTIITVKEGTVQIILVQEPDDEGI